VRGIIALNHSRKYIVKINWAESLRQQVHSCAESLGNLFVETFHYLALFAIGAVTAWAAVMAFLGMLEKGHITVDDILLLFIYLELGAMVGIYFKTNHMPVRFLIYVAITALTRLLISDASCTSVVRFCCWRLRSLSCVTPPHNFRR
jgi:phosphate starvation-inducible membrane PsiE